MSNFKFFKHKEKNLLATQSSFTNGLVDAVDEGVEYFEVQIEISGVMHGKLRKFNPEVWEEISNEDFIYLMVNKDGFKAVSCEGK
jgi:hypothetical protein